MSCPYDNSSLNTGCLYVQVHFIELLGENRQGLGVIGECDLAQETLAFLFLLSI